MSDDCCEAHGLARPCQDCAEQGVIELSIHEQVVEQRDILKARNEALLAQIAKLRRPEPKRTGIQPELGKTYMDNVGRLWVIVDWRRDPQPRDEHVKWAGVLIREREGVGEEQLHPFDENRLGWFDDEGFYQNKEFERNLFFFEREVQRAVPDGRRLKPA